MHAFIASLRVYSGWDFWLGNEGKIVKYQCQAKPGSRQQRCGLGRKCMFSCFVNVAESRLLAGIFVVNGNSYERNKKM